MDTTENPNAREPSGSWLEASNLDAVAEYFRQHDTEPGYEEIASMVVPLKYVNAQFKVYPLVLGDKDGVAKVRLLSNAAALHLGLCEETKSDNLEGQGGWFGAMQRVSFLAGDKEAPQNAIPRWRSGYLPVAEFVWEQGGARYTLEAFATLLPDTTTHLCAWINVKAQRLSPDATVAFHARFEGEPLSATGNTYLSHAADGRPLRAGYSDNWKFDETTQTLTWELDSERQSGEACLVILDQPAPHGILLEWPAIRPVGWAINLDRSTQESGFWLAQWAQPQRWAEVRDEYCRFWDSELAAAGEVQVDDPVVMAAHRSVRIASRIIATRNQMSYSAHNSYQRVYTDEAAQAVVGLAYWGHTEDAARYLGHLAFYAQNGLMSHDLGLRLHWFCRYLSLTGDSRFLDRNAPRMRRWAQQLLDDITAEHHGLARPGHYCGDIHTMTYSLSANAVAWRGIRDFAVLTGDGVLAARAEEYRAAIRAAAEATIDDTVEPPFLPMSLYGDEPTPDALNTTTLSSYWDLMAPYALYAGALGDEHRGTTAMLDSFRQRGGLCGGLVRFTCHADYTQLQILLECGLDDLYGAKLADVFARADDAETLVLMLYGKLGLGLTPETFVGGEGASLVPSKVFGEESSDGRSFYLPPNSASQMMFAIVLRHCLVFDFDAHGDGRYDTLRLAFATPRRWLEDGKRIVVRDMPTAFGTVGYEITSHIDTHHAVEATVDLPARRRPESVYLRLRVPGQGRRLGAVFVNDQAHANFDADSEIVDLSQFHGRVHVRAEYSGSR